MMFLTIAAAAWAAQSADVREAESLGMSEQSFGVQLRWPRGVPIRYYIDTEESRSDTTDPLPENDPRIKYAISVWERRTCIRFTQCKTADECEEPYIRFLSTDRGCSTSLGMPLRGHRQVRLAFNCAEGAVIHEIGHTLALGHEHSRFDRDSFVFFNESNMDRRHRMQFRVNWRSVALGPYDHRSVMHYSDVAGTQNGQPVLESAEMTGQSSTLSKGDVETVEFLYNHCSNDYEAPTCMASYPQGVRHLLAYDKAYLFDFSGSYTLGENLYANYSFNLDGTIFRAERDHQLKLVDAQDGDLVSVLQRRPLKDENGKTVKDENGKTVWEFYHIGVARTLVFFEPTEAEVGKVFNVSVAFTAEDGTVTACGFEVEVAKDAAVCFGKTASDPDVCSGHGKCTGPISAPCECYPGYGGADCSGLEHCPQDVHSRFDDEDEVNFVRFGHVDNTRAALGTGSWRIGFDEDSRDIEGESIMYLNTSKPVAFSLYWAIDGVNASRQLAFRERQLFNLNEEAVNHTCFGLWWEDGAFVLHGQDGSKKLIEAAPSKFHNTVFLPNWAEQTFDVLVNNRMVLADEPFITACPNGVDRLYSYGKAWIDEFRLHCTAPPCPKTGWLRRRKNLFKGKGH